jgi:hypothetical protein
MILERQNVYIAHIAIVIISRVNLLIILEKAYQSEVDKTLYDLTKVALLMAA